MPTSIALPTSHHFHPSLSPVVSLSWGILHEWMRLRMIAKPSLNFLQQTATWMKNIHDDLSLLDLGIYEAGDLAQNRPLWRLISLHTAMHS